MPGEWPVTSLNRSNYLLRYLPELRTFQGKVVHESFVVEDKGDDRVPDGIGIDFPANAKLDDRNAAIDTGFPAIAVDEVVQSLFRHEHDDFGFGLSAQLKPHRDGSDPVILLRLPRTTQYTLAQFPAYANSSLQDSWKYQYPGCFGPERLGCRLGGIKLLDHRVSGCIDFDFAG